MDNKKWFKEAQFGMLIHFGLYSIPTGEWNGSSVQNWAMVRNQFAVNSKFQSLMQKYENLI